MRSPYLSNIGTEKLLSSSRAKIELNSNLVRFKNTETEKLSGNKIDQKGVGWSKAKNRPPLPSHSLLQVSSPLSPTHSHSHPSTPLSPALTPLTHTHTLPSHSPSHLTHSPLHSHLPPHSPSYPTHSPTCQISKSLNLKKFTSFILFSAKLYLASCWQPGKVYFTIPAGVRIRIRRVRTHTRAFSSGNVRTFSEKRQKTIMKKNREKKSKKNIHKIDVKQ